MKPLVLRTAAAWGVLQSAVNAIARSLAVVTWQGVATVLGLSAVWAWSVTVHVLPSAWNDNWLFVWITERLSGEFACMVLIAVVMALPLLMVSRFGPQDGWQRYVSLAAAIALLAAPSASLVRNVYLAWAYDEPLGNGLRVSALSVAMLSRYAGLASLLTIVGEFQRRETRSIESMHRAEVDRLELDREMDEARLQVLQAQIEPHFLFNTLANVRRLYQTDRELGPKMLDNLMQYLEVALPHMRESRSTVARELALAEAYLRVQRIRMGPRLEFSIDVPQVQRCLDLPPMMLLTLVENAIKHGLNPMPDGGAIHVRAALDGDSLRIDVEDTGRGFHATSGGGAGLANIQARLNAMYGAAATLDLAENKPRGVIATLRVPARPGTLAVATAVQ